MKTINHYRVEVVDPDYAGLMGRDNTFKCSTHNVLGENDRRLVIDNFYFTSISKEKNGWDTCLDKPAISLYANDTCYGTRVTYSLYTEKAKRASTIRKEIEAAIEKKYGFFARGFDLSFIDEKEAA